MLPVPTIAQLADFSGRSEDSYPDYTPAKLRQATVLMAIRTCLVSMPADTLQAELLLNGILELADQLVLETPYQELKVKPFSSETIMSYSYTRSAQKARLGLDTGLMWFELAVSELSVCGDGENPDIAFDSISIFERDGVTYDGEGRPQVLGPDGMYDPSPLWYSTNSVNEVK